MPEDEKFPIAGLTGPVLAMNPVPRPECGNSSRLGYFAQADQTKPTAGANSTEGVSYRPRPPTKRSDSGLP